MFGASGRRDDGDEDGDHDDDDDGDKDDDDGGDDDESRPVGRGSTWTPQWYQAGTAAARRTSSAS